jgi:hypothetical protein
VTIRNGRLDSWGLAIRLEDASFNLIRDVRSTNNRSGFLLDGGESNTVRSAFVDHLDPHGFGLHALASEGLVVADSTGLSFSVVGNDARLVRNTIGADAVNFTCIDVNGNRNRVADNHITGCLHLLAGSDNELVGNEVRGSNGDGIRIDVFTAATLLEGNFAHLHTGDGIDVRAPGTRLKDNQADQNGGFGIDAVAGVTDLGGNTASQNSPGPQCRNVVCTAPP